MRWLSVNVFIGGTMKRIVVLLVSISVVTIISTISIIYSAKQRAVDSKQQLNNDDDSGAGNATSADSATINKALKIGKTNHRMAVLLSRHMKSNKPNEFYSPFSISSALSMTFLGAQNMTKSEMQEVFGYKQSDQELVKHYQALNALINQDSEGKITSLNVANSIFIRKTKGQKLLPAFIADLRTGFETQAFTLDFSKSKESVDFINKWVEKQTNNKMKNFVNPTHLERAQTILINALYFKSRWIAPFQEVDTKLDIFYASVEGNQNPKQVQLMHQIDFFDYIDLGSFHVVELPYTCTDLAMYVWLPKDKNADPPEISSKTLEQIFQNMVWKEVDLYLPKFTMHKTYNLKPTLQAIGMKIPFDSERADFGRIMNIPLFISEVLHEAFVEVDEKGTEAAATTEAIEGCGASFSEPSLPQLFRVDHPFTFTIVHNPSQSILFVGKVQDPTIK